MAEEVEELKTRQDKSPPLKYKKGEKDRKQKSIEHEYVLEVSAGAVEQTDQTNIT